MLLIPTMIMGVALATPGPTLAATPPSSRGKGVEPERITIRTEDRIDLAADYFAPKSTQTRAPAAILVHDAGGNRRQMELFAERLHGQGLAVLVLDLRGHGQSRTPETDWTTLDEGGRVRLWAYAPRDIEAATAWLKTRREVHTANLTMVGLRSGCALAANHAARDDNVRAVVLIEPVEDQLGFDLKAEVASLAGLETKVFTPRERQEEARTIQSNATKANDGLEFIEIDLCKSRGDELLHDRRVASEVARWVEDRVFPKKGRR